MRAIVERIYERFMQGDVKPLADVLADDVTWTIRGPQTPVPIFGVFRGPEQTMDWLATLADTLVISEMTPDRWFQEGDTVVVLGHDRSVLKANGQNASSRWAHIWESKNSRLVAFEETPAFEPDIVAALKT